MGNKNPQRFTLCEFLRVFIFFECGFNEGEILAPPCHWHSFPPPIEVGDIGHLVITKHNINNNKYVDIIPKRRKTTAFRYGECHVCKV